MQVQDLLCALDGEASAFSFAACAPDSGQAPAWHVVMSAFKQSAKHLCGQVYPWQHTGP